MPGPQTQHKGTVYTPGERLGSCIVQLLFVNPFLCCCQSGPREKVIALGFEPARLCEPVSPAPLDGLPLADSTHTYLRLCAPSTVTSAAGSGRKVLAVPQHHVAVHIRATTPDPERARQDRPPVHPRPVRGSHSEPEESTQTQSTSGILITVLVI